VTWRSAGFSRGRMVKYTLSNLTWRLRLDEAAEPGVDTLIEGWYMSTVITVSVVRKNLTILISLIRISLILVPQTKPSQTWPEILLLQNLTVDLRQAPLHPRAEAKPNFGQTSTRQYSHIYRWTVYCTQCRLYASSFQKSYLWYLMIRMWCVSRLTNWYYLY